MPAAGMGFLGVILYVQPFPDSFDCNHLQSLVVCRTGRCCVFDRALPASAVASPRSCTNIKDVIRMSKDSAAGQALGVSRHDMLI